MDLQINSQQWAENMGFIMPTKPSMSLTSMAIDACSESGKGNGAITFHQLLFLTFPLQKALIIHL